MMGRIRVWRRRAGIIAGVFFGCSRLVVGAADLPRIDLAANARVFTSHVTPGDEFAIANAVDGDPETKWVGEGHPLTWQPTNIVLEFNPPQTVSRLVLVSQVHRDVLALKDFEVCAWAQKTWAGAAPLAVVKATQDLRNVVDFAPVTTRRLRIRIRDTWRDDHAFPRLTEIEVYGAPPGVKSERLDDAPIADEKKSERMLLARALGEFLEFPGTPFDPAKGYLHYARAVLDTMINEGADRYGPVHSPMFASLLDMETHRIPDDTPANVPGQRTGDRAMHGGNLMHDVMLLRACDLLTSLTGEEKYRRAATAYLAFFLENCPQPTGLFPWGEHAHWDFFREAPGHTVHEYLGGVPVAFWERLWALNPGALRHHADGLINHVVNLETFDFNRHADIRKPLPTPRPTGMGFLDFPRHAGFLIHTWTFAYAKTSEPQYLDWSLAMIDHHWRARHPVSGLPPSCTRGDQAQTASMESALSLSVSLLEAARLLPVGEAKTRYESVARAYLASVVRLPHRPREGRFIAAFPIDAAPESAAGSLSEPYQYGYGGGFSCDDGSLLLAAHRLTGDRRARELAEALAGYYSEHDPPPASEIVRAHVYAAIVGLFVDLYTLTDNAAYLAQAERYGRLAVERLFWNGLLRGATGINHYEGDMMAGNLIYNLLWLHAAEAKTNERVEPNYFNR